MKVDYGYNFIRITCVAADISDNKITFPEDPIFGKYPIIVYCEDTGTLYTGAYDDGDVTLSEYGSGSGGGGGDESDIVYVPISVDFSGDDPVVSCETSYNTLKGYIESGKIVYLTQSYDGGILLYSLCGYNFTYQKIEWTHMHGTSPVEYNDIAIEENEWSYNYRSLQYVSV